MSITLEAQLREISGKRCRSLRAKNIIPGQIYNTEHNTNVQFNEKELQNALKKAGTTALIEVKIDSKIYSVLVKETQYSLNRQRVTYADFYEVNMKNKIITTVPVKVIGTNILLEEKNAILVLGATSIEIEALPNNIPAVIEVDISAFETFSDSIKARDIKLPEGIALVGKIDKMIATCGETRVSRQIAQEDVDEAATEDVDEAATEDVDKAK